MGPNPRSDSPEAQLVSVAAITRCVHGLKRLDLVSADGTPLAPFEAGDHIEVLTPTGDSRPYSLCGDPARQDVYSLAILREAGGRGGSKAMHDRVAVGSLLEVSRPRHSFPLVEQGRHWRLVAGGIGATPLVAMAHRLNAIGASFEFHYCASRADRLIFLDELRGLVPPDRLHIHVSGGDPGARFRPADWLGQGDEHVYCCGPEALMSAVSAATADWSPDLVHIESFKPSIPDDATEFEVELGRSGALVRVARTESVLVALWKAGYRRPLSCETGICGTCRTPFLAGEVEHRDAMLTDEERKREMLICVSRCRSARLVLDI